MKTSSKSETYEILIPHDVRAFMSMVHDIFMNSTDEDIEKNIDAWSFYFHLDYAIHYKNRTFLDLYEKTKALKRENLDEAKAQKENIQEAGPTQERPRDTDQQGTQEA